MAIVLQILKIIGMVILALLALLIFIALLVLFVPIRYKVTGEIEETDLSTEASLLPERIHLKAGFSWLLHFVSGGIDYPDSKQFTVKILCFKIFPFKEKEGKEEEAEKDKADLPNEMEEGFEDKKEEKDKTEAKEESGTESSDNKKDSKEEGKKSSNSGEEASTESEENATQENTENTEDTEDSENADSDEFEDEEKESFFEFLGKIFNTIADIIRIPQNVLEKLQCTISSICAKIDMIKNTLNNDIFKRGFAVTKKQVIRVLKMVLPRKCRINIKIGMEDPTVTADIFAAYGFLYPILAGKIFIEPSFDRPVLEGTVYIKGKIRVFKIAWAAAILFFNKDVKKTIRRFKKILNS